MKHNAQSVGESSYLAPDIMVWSVEAEMGFASSNFQGLVEDPWAWEE